MNIEYLTEARYKDFIDFCKKHRNELDDSFLYDEDLADFQADEENPTYIVLDENSRIIAAVSLLQDSYYKRGKKGRFRIFHSVEPNIEIYEQMLHSIKSHTKDIEDIFVFIHEDNIVVRDIFHSMQFDIERYSYFLAREALDVTVPDLPDDFYFGTFTFNKDEEDYLYVRNAGFATLKGSETPRTLEEIKGMENDEEYLEGGIFLLYHGEKPVGIVRSSKDVHNNEDVLDIGPLALIPEYQGKGLGRQLLRKALEFGKSKGLPKAVLCVNADNEQAVHLYTKEGFEKEESLVCYHYTL
ncbi:GNAT family N-acetyltransferase [Halobacillus salinus]|uniref:GNAT family N-acetyltransferase n=1 Tax=Halobacillus salinus TaxID=192814 RepID=A0A4Z0GZF4_9BACI|nr:GNAT family N-acetyltransferase [Halobacillus salinus]TGB03568.1 GNAT family N-acetyltransferase [Halobacillus salinus]